MKPLAEAVTTHIREMSTVAENAPRVKEELSILERAGKRSPSALRPKTKSLSAGSSRRDDPSPAELQELLEFLEALSPLMIGPYAEDRSAGGTGAAPAATGMCVSEKER